MRWGRTGADRGAAPSVGVVPAEVDPVPIKVAMMPSLRTRRMRKPEKSAGAERSSANAGWRPAATQTKPGSRTSKCTFVPRNAPEIYTLPSSGSYATSRGLFRVAAVARRPSPVDPVAPVPANRLMIPVVPLMNRTTLPARSCTNTASMASLKRWRHTLACLHEGSSLQCSTRRGTRRFKIRGVHAFE